MCGEDFTRRIAFAADRRLCAEQRALRQRMVAGDLPLQRRALKTVGKAVFYALLSLWRFRQIS